MNEMQRLGQLIRQTMESRGLKGYELAAALGVQTSAVSRMINGQNANPPDPKLFADLSRVLELPREEMLIALGYLERDAPAAEKTNGPQMSIMEAVNRYEWDEEDALWVVDFIETVMKRKRRG